MGEMTPILDRSTFGGIPPCYIDALKDKVAIVTGAGCMLDDGIGNGRACAIFLAQAGASVVCVDRILALAERTVELIGSGLALTGDVSLPHDCQRICQEAVSHYGRIDVLVNNVGISGPSGDAVKVDHMEWARGLEVNVTSMMLMSKYAIPEMLKNPGTLRGSIVHMSSVAGMIGGQNNQLLYATAKGAVIQMTRAMAAQQGPQGIRVNCVCPGRVHTPMVYTRGLTDEQRATKIRRSLLGTEGYGWDVAAAVRFLASNEARWITGVILPVDAGLTASAVPT